MTPSITVVDPTNQPADTQLVDVRSPSEFAAGHIPGAINIPMDQIESRLGDFRQSSLELVRCWPKSGIGMPHPSP